MIAFDDTELCEWLMDVTENQPQVFLCTLAEAAVQAGDEDYSTIRHALFKLKRKYSRVERGEAGQRRSLAVSEQMAG